MEATVYIGIRIPPDLKERLETVCEEQQRSMTQVCKIFLLAGVDTYPANFMPVKLKGKPNGLSSDDT